MVQIHSIARHLVVNLVVKHFQVLLYILEAKQLLCRHINWLSYYISSIVFFFLITNVS